MGLNGHLPLLVSVPDGGIWEGMRGASPGIQLGQEPVWPSQQGRWRMCRQPGRVAALRETAPAIGSASHRWEGVAFPDLDGQVLAETAEEAADGPCRAREREWGVVGAA